jgi:hypothetical protein
VATPTPMVVTATATTAIVTTAATVVILTTIAAIGRTKGIRGTRETRTDNEALTVVAMCVCNPDYSPARIHG